jgi:purine-binding chemotaxis protein CheW
MRSICFAPHIDKNFKPTDMSDLPKTGAGDAIEPGLAAPQAYLSFTVGSEEYALDAHHVLEIRHLEPLKPVPSAPAFVKGVIELRGAAVPIVDLRTLLGAADDEPQQPAAVMVIHMHGGTVGMIVDAVSGLVELAPDQIRPAPRLDLGQGIVKPKQRKRRKAAPPQLLH